MALPDPTVASVGMSSLPILEQPTIMASHQGLIFLFIAFQFGAYIVIRQLVNAKEWLSACARVVFYPGSFYLTFSTKGVVVEGFCESACVMLRHTK